MSLKSIKSNLGAERGFTIVELLIVVVVIAILAAITIVSYNGITNNAKKSSAQSAATTFAKKAELYLADRSRYPVTAAELSTASAGKAWEYAATGVTNAAALSAAPTDPNTITFLKCAATSVANQSLITTSNISGLQISWWDYVSGGPVTLNTGTTTSCPTTMS